MTNLFSIPNLDGLSGYVQVYTDVKFEHEVLFTEPGGNVLMLGASLSLLMGEKIAQIKTDSFDLPDGGGKVYIIHYNLTRESSKVDIVWRSANNQKNGELRFDTETLLQQICPSSVAQYKKNLKAFFDEK